MFKAAVITHRNEFSRQLGQRLGSELVDELGQIPTACWLFCWPQDFLEDLLAGVIDVVGTDSLIGCTTDGEISTTGLTTESAILGGIATDQMEFHVVSVENIGARSEDAGRELARLLPSNVGYIQLVTDGLTGNGSAVLRGMNSIFGPRVPIAGGTAGDAGRFRRTYQFAGNKLLTDAAVAVGFSGKFKVGTGVRSGWLPIGTPKKVTHSVGNVVYELNGQPALDVYKRFLGEFAEKLPEVGVEYPLGLVGEWGFVGETDYHLLRATMSVNHQNGSISFAGDVPEGAVVRMTCGDHSSILEAAGKAASLAIDDLGDATPVMVFFYSCMARRIVLGTRTQEEVEIVRKTCGTDLPLVGFYTYGEYCRVKRGGPSLLHNETATISVIGV